MLYLMVDQDLCDHQDPRVVTIGPPDALSLETCSGATFGVEDPVAKPAQNLAVSIHDIVEFAVLISGGDDRLAFHQESLAVCDNGACCRVAADTADIPENLGIPRSRILMDLRVVLWSLPLVDFEAVPGVPMVGSQDGDFEAILSVDGAAEDFSVSEVESRHDEDQSDGSSGEFQYLVKKNPGSTSADKIN